MEGEQVMHRKALKNLYHPQSPYIECCCRLLKVPKIIVYVHPITFSKFLSLKLNIFLPNLSK